MAEVPSGIPFWLPPTVALVSSVSMGLTSFGDAIVFHSLWAAAGALGLYDASHDTLASAVLYIVIMPLACLPAMLWATRADLRRCAGWGTLCASSSVTTIPLGAALLLHTDVGLLKVCAGCFFLLFSVSQILASAARGGGRRPRGGRARAMAIPMLIVLRAIRTRQKKAAA